MWRSSGYLPDPRLIVFNTYLAAGSLFHLFEVHARQGFNHRSIVLSLLMRLGKRFGRFDETAALKQQDGLRRAAAHLFMHYLQAFPAYSCRILTRAT